MGDRSTGLRLVRAFCIALGVVAVLLCAPVHADPPVGVPGQGKGLLKKLGGDGNGLFGGGGGASTINNALSNWQTMPSQSQTPGLMRVSPVDSLPDGGNPGTTEKGSGNDPEKKGKVRVEVSQTQSLEMMSDKIPNGSPEALYSQVINRQNIPRGNTLGRSSDGTLRIYGHQGGNVPGNEGISFEGGQLEMMEDVYQSGLK